MLTDKRSYSSSACRNGWRRNLDYVLVSLTGVPAVRFDNLLQDRIVVSDMYSSRVCRQAIEYSLPNFVAESRLSPRSGQRIQWCSYNYLNETSSNSRAQISLVKALEVLLEDWS